MGCVPAGDEGFLVVAQGRVAGPDGLPVLGAQVVVVGDDAAALGTATSDEEGRWDVAIYGSSSLGNVLHAEVDAPGFAPGRASWLVNLLSAESATLHGGPVQDWEYVPRPLACVRLAGEGTGASVVGRVIDPGGSPVSGQSGILQWGWDAGVGDAAVASFVTDAEGGFSALVDVPGVYTVYIAPASGWGGTRFPILTTPFAEPVTGVMAPAQTPGSLLSSVLWSGDVDLDLHLTGPAVAAKTENDRFHVWADAPRYTPREGAEVAAELVRGATTGPGPEVIQVSTPVAGGEFRLSVMDRTDAGVDENPALAQSDALVQWWDGEDTPRYAWVSPLELATTWQPVQLDTHQATVYAVEGYQSDVDPTDLAEF